MIPMQRRVALAVVCWLISVSVSAAQTPSEMRAQSVFEHAITLFSQGKVAESAAEFDGLIRIENERSPFLWQRGIALYYAGRYSECRKQFELHRTVNPDDVENAAWHFLCVARDESPARARQLLLPVGPDSRRPMAEIYQMFRGTLTPDQVLAAAGTSAAGRFYARLYVGLYEEAIGNRERAGVELRQAASDEFAAAGGYMHMVARVHVGLLGK